MLKRIFAVLATLLAAFFILGTPAQAAGNAHFIQSATNATLSGPDLVVKFKEAGLSAGSTETITVTAHLDATYQCVNNGGKVPSDPKKTTVSRDVSKSGQFTAGQNGNVTGGLTVSAPAPSTILDCPGGQKATLTQWSYSAVVISDSTSGASTSLTGAFTGHLPGF